MNQTSSESASSALRLWPAIVLLAALWGLKYLPLLIPDPPLYVFMIGFFGPTVCVLLIVIWWVAGSRATRREKLIGFGSWTLVRMDEVWGDFTTDRAWRWEPTTEERFLAERSSPSGGTGLVEEITRFKVVDGKTWNHPVLVGDRLYARNAKEAVAFEMPVD